MSLRNIVGCLVAVACAGVAPTGCNPDGENKPKSKTLEGEIVRVDAARGRVAMRVRDPKDKTTFLKNEVEGSVTQKTEIMINGKAGKLADLREKDVVEATGYQQGKNQGEQIVAEVIKVERPMEIVTPQKPETQANTAAPSTQPVNANGDLNKLGYTSNAQPNANTAQSNAGNPGGVSPKSIELLQLFVAEVQKQRAKAVTDRDQLLKEGEPKDDPEVLRLENVIAKADMALAQVQDESAKKGVILETSAPPASQPAPAAKP